MSSITVAYVEHSIILSHVHSIGNPVLDPVGVGEVRVDILGSEEIEVDGVGSSEVDIDITGSCKVDISGSREVDLAGSGEVIMGEVIIGSVGTIEFDTNNAGSAEVAGFEDVEVVIVYSVKVDTDIADSCGVSIDTIGSSKVDHTAEDSTAIDVKDAVYLEDMGIEGIVGCTKVDIRISGPRKVENDTTCIKEVGIISEGSMEVDFESFNEADIGTSGSTDMNIAGSCEVGSNTEDSGRDSEVADMDIGISDVNTT